MKHLAAILSLYSLAVSGAAYAAPNSYAPTLPTLVVERDLAEGDYSPFPFHNIMGLGIEIGTDPSCHSLVVGADGLVACLAADQRRTVVGRLGSSQGIDEGWEMISVTWNDRVEIASNESAEGLRYVLRLKN